MGRPDEPGLGSVVGLAAAPCRRHVLRTDGAAQYLVLADPWRIVQLRCIGEKIGAEPFALELVLDRFPDVEAGLRLAKTLADLHRGRPAPRRLRDGTVEGQRHRDAIAALDRRQERWTYREIAVFLHGEDAVGRRWTDPDRTMKKRTIRSVQRGHRMMEGGYRTLLR